MCEEDLFGMLARLLALAPAAEEKEEDEEDERCGAGDCDADYGTDS